MSKVALITGSAQGIGRSIALQLAKDGYKISIADLSHQFTKAQEVQKKIKSIGSESIFIPIDVSNRSDVFKAVELTYNKLGGFNTMINNAGIVIPGSINDITEETWIKSSNINIGGIIWGIQASSCKFKELKQPGKILNAGSVASHQGYSFLGQYSATKHAIKGLTQSSSKELAKFGITVNCYCPGIVPSTKMWDGIDKMTGDFSGETRRAMISKFIKNVALQREGMPQDVANLVSWLCSDSSWYVTGQSYLVDGGMCFN